MKIKRINEKLEMIIIGYQGIGKSTLARSENGYIDLESRCFWNDGKRPDDWYIYYCQIAEHLSKQGYVVFVSTHQTVRDFLRESAEVVITIYPSILLADKWKNKLKKRYESTRTEKDYKAWMNAENYYHVNISHLMMCGIPHLEIENTNYDLDKIIRAVIKKNPEVFPDDSYSKLMWA